MSVECDWPMKPSVPEVLLTRLRRLIELDSRDLVEFPAPIREMAKRRLIFDAYLELREEGLASAAKVILDEPTTIDSQHRWERVYQGQKKRKHK